MNSMHPDRVCMEPMQTLSGCVHFMKGTQSSCRLSGCTDLCTLYKGYTEFMQTIRVHKPVYIYEGYTEFMQTIRVHKTVYTL